MADNNMSVMLVVKAAVDGEQAQIEQFAKEAKADLKGVGESGKSAASAVGETGAAASGLKSLASAAGVAGVAMGVFSEVGERIIGWVMDLPNKVLQAAQDFTFAVRPTTVVASMTRHSARGSPPRR